MEKLLFWSETSKILSYLENIGWDFQQSEKKPTFPWILIAV